MKKIELLKACVEILERPKVSQWYSENLEKKSQSDTINSLVDGVSKGKISIREALSIALVVGAQWNEKFEGVP